MQINALLYDLSFGIMALITIGGGIATVSVRNVFHAGLFLIATFFGVAGLYLLLEAEFIALVQVLIYVGAISVLVLFAIMLTRGLMRDDRGSMNAQWVAALVLALALFAGILLLAFQYPWPSTGAPVTTDITPVLGLSFVTTYALPFEVASLLLLAALIGAFVIARE